MALVFAGRARTMTDTIICQIKPWVEVLAALFAIGAAAWWGVSVYWGWFPFLNTPMADVQRFLTHQGRCNAAAAGCAAIAALLQLSLTYFPSCRAFG
jgi:hypothetical protein